MTDDRLRLKNALVVELPTYVAAAALYVTPQPPGPDKPLLVPDVNSSIEVWWQANAGNIPAWAEFARLVFTTTPSSAAAERVFSRLRRTFQKTQEHALEGLVEATLMAQCNGFAM
jgi:hypothetical protein